MADPLLEPWLGTWQVKETSANRFLYRFATEYKVPTEDSNGTMIRHVKWSEWRDGACRNRRQAIRLAKASAKKHKRHVLPRMWAGRV